MPITVSSQAAMDESATPATSHDISTTAADAPVHQGPADEPQVRERAGASAGINVSPGSEDDGWIVPPPVQLADGTTVQLFKDGEALGAAFKAIKEAQRRICMEAYIFANDDTGNAFADLLCQKAREGVAVYVIYDSFGSFALTQLYRPKPDMFDRMRASGVRLQEFHPIRPWEVRFTWRPLNRDHRKLLVVDDMLGGLGGLNVGKEYAGSWVVTSEQRDDELWRDNAVGVVGPGARHLLQSFINTWNYVAHGGRIRRAGYEYGRGGEPFGLLASVPTVESPLRNYLCEYLAHAKETIDMTMAYFAPDDQLVHELLKAARRGVRVRLMLPSRSDVRPLIWAAQSFYERLMDAGVEIYERLFVILHAKTMVVDRSRTVLGSTNLDQRSIEYNCELSAIVRDHTFGKQMELLFENDMRYARKIDPDEWRHRGVRDRITQWAVMRARYLL